MLLNASVDSRNSSGVSSSERRSFRACALMRPAVAAMRRARFSTSRTAQIPSAAANSTLATRVSSSPLR